MTNTITPSVSIFQYAVIAIILGLTTVIPYFIVTDHTGKATFFHSSVVIPCIASSVNHSTSL